MTGPERTLLALTTFLPEWISITLEKKQAFTLFCFSLVSFIGFSQWQVEP
jgi:hypothetical protein